MRVRNWRWRTVPPGAVLAVSGLLAAAPATWAQRDQQIRVPLMALNQGQAVQSWHVQGRVYMLVGAGSNITVQVGDEAVVLVNAGRADMSPQVIAAVRRLSDKPIEYIIDTSADEDDVGGSSAVAKLGFANTGQPGEPAGAGVIGQLMTLDRLSSQPPEGAEAPTDAFDDQWSFFNNEAIILQHAPAAHTGGDTYVFFRRSDVISTGDVFDTDLYPVIDAAHGGSIDGIINALNDIIAITVPEQNEEGGTLMVPGHGRVCDRTELVNYRDALTIIRARIAYYVGKGMSLQQILAARPTMDYDGIYGADSGPWTTHMFVEAVYRDVLAQSRHVRRS